MKIYRLHNCTKAHRSYRAMSGCIWKGANVEGNGPYAVVHWVQPAGMRAVPDVLLYDSESEADDRYNAMSQPFYCGGSCRRAGGRHLFVKLDLDSLSEES